MRLSFLRNSHLLAAAIFCFTGTSLAAVNCKAHFDTLPHFVIPGKKYKVDVTEQRFSTVVPLDYANPDGPKIEVVSRFLAADGKRADDNSVPTILVINGGPGGESSGYRKYERAVLPNGSLEPFAETGIGGLLKGAHVVLFDQRGTVNGLSTRIDLSKVQSAHDVAEVSRLFGSVAIARDVDLIVKKLKSNGRKVAVLGQSYGGTALAHYATLPRKSVQPDAYLFTAAMLPYYQNPDSIQTFRPRREEQLRLNLALRAAFPEVVELSMDLEAHLIRLGLNPKIKNYLFESLGGKEGEWQTQMIAKIRELLTADRAKIEEELIHTITPPLNYILSSSEFTPGTTDNIASKTLMKETPFEKWMFDEFAVQFIPESYLDWPGGIALANIVDDHIPPGAWQPKATALARAMKDVPTLLTFSNNDAFVPATFKAIAQKNFTRSGVTFLDLDGAHRAALNTGADKVLEWLKKNVGTR